jgi:CHASE3 domain sensor protein
MKLRNEEERRLILFMVIFFVLILIVSGIFFYGLQNYNKAIMDKVSREATVSSSDPAGVFKGMFLKVINN